MECILILLWSFLCILCTFASYMTLLCTTVMGDFPFIKKKGTSQCNFIVLVSTGSPTCMWFPMLWQCWAEELDEGATEKVESRRPTALTHSGDQGSDSLRPGRVTKANLWTRSTVIWVTTNQRRAKGAERKRPNEKRNKEIAGSKYKKEKKKEGEKGERHH